MRTKQTQTPIQELYLQGGLRINLPFDLAQQIRRSAEFPIIERSSQVACKQPTATAFVIEVTTNWGNVKHFPYPFTTNSDRKHRQAFHRKEVIGKYTYSRGLSLEAETLPQELPPNFCSLFAPVRLFPDPHCSWGDLNWFGVENAKRLGDHRLADPQFLRQVREASASFEQLPEDDPQRLEWQRKMDEIDSLRYGKTDEEVTYGSGDPLGMALIRSFRLLTPLFYFGQQHFVFQSRILLFLRLEAVNILEQIKRHFEDPVTKMVGNLPAEQFRAIYLDALNHQRTPVDEELFMAWHPSQHGAVPLLLEHFDPDLLIRFLPVKYREVLRREAIEWREYIFGWMTILTTEDMKAQARSVFELLPSQDNPSLLDFLKRHPNYGKSLREQEERLDYVLSLPFDIEQIEVLIHLGLCWMDEPRFEYLLRKSESGEKEPRSKKKESQKPNLVDYLESQPGLQEQLRAELEERNCLFQLSRPAEDVSTIKGMISDWPPGMRQKLLLELDHPLRKYGYWGKDAQPCRSDPPQSPDFHLDDEKKKQHRKIVKAPFRRDKQELEDHSDVLGKAIASTADKLALQVHRHALENARRFLTEGHGPAVAIVAHRVETLYAMVGLPFKGVWEGKLGTTSKQDVAELAQETTASPHAEHPLLALKRELLKFSFTAKRIALYRPRMAAYPDDTTLKQLVVVLDKADRLPPFRLLTPDQRNEYWDTRHEMTLLRKQLTKEVRSFRPPPLSKGEIARLDKEYYHERTGCTLSDADGQPTPDDT